MKRRSLLKIFGIGAAATVVKPNIDSVWPKEKAQERLESAQDAIYEISPIESPFGLGRLHRAPNPDFPNGPRWIEWIEDELV